MGAYYGQYYGTRFMIVLSMFAIGNNVISWLEVSFAMSAQSILFSVNLIDYTRPDLVV
jgi:hypothetical protein